MEIFFSFIKGEEAAVFCGFMLFSLLCTYVSLGKYWESVCSPPSWYELCWETSSELTSLPPHLSVTCWGERKSQAYLWRIVQDAVQITVLKPKSAIAGCTNMLSLYSKGMTSSTTRWRLKWGWNQRGGGLKSSSFLLNSTLVVSPTC